MDDILAYYRNYLKQKGLRQTKQREIITRAFLLKKGHICVDELYYQLRKKFSRLGHTTVFRTLKLLKQAQIAGEVNFTGKRRRFEPTINQTHHDHLVCTKCGKVAEFFDSEIEKRQEKLCKKYKFYGSHHLMEIFGLCRRCQRRIKRNVEKKTN
ncbi:MAG: Fur family transcriptional regulator [bacterium]